MFNPQYRVLLTKNCFYSDNAICLGTQLILIINTLKEFLPEHTWYGADIEAIGKNANKFNTNKFTLKYIGNDLQINQYCSEIDQFMSGVFLCVNNEFLLATWN